MSVTQVKDSLTRSITAFNEKRKLLPAVYVNDNIHSATWQEEQLKAERGKLRKEYILDASRILASLAVEEKETVLKIGKMKFPAATSYSDSVKTTGEIQINSANLFLMREHSPEHIIQTIRDAIAMKRIDFAFALIEGAREQLKPKSDLELPKSADVAALAEIDALVAGFDSKGEIEIMTKELQDAPEVSRTAQAFQKFLSNENVTTSFIPMWDIKKMSQADMTRIGVESINQSMSLQPEESTT
jgi:hypothetical protein